MDLFGERAEAEQARGAFAELEPPPPPPPRRVQPDLSKMGTFVYPVDFPKREYQFEMATAAIKANTLVALPTGLGKTFIAGVVMYNFWRWFPGGKVLFVAPTRPLVTQQMRACHEIMGIPESDGAEMTGELESERRAPAWRQKRVFFLTPQTLKNDVENGVCPADEVVLLVVDECHRATGENANSVAVREARSPEPRRGGRGGAGLTWGQLARRNAWMRVVGLTATPGSDAASVQAVVDNLLVERVAARSEGDPDVAPHVHGKEPEVKRVAPSREALAAAGLLRQLLDTPLALLHRAGALDPSRRVAQAALTAAEERYSAGAAQAAAPRDASRVFGAFRCALELLSLVEEVEKRGLRPALPLIEAFQREASASQYLHRCDVAKDARFDKLLRLVRGAVARGVSHHKVDAVARELQGHFAAPGAGATRAMVFASLRTTVALLEEALEGVPGVRALPFVGQGASAQAGAAKGLSQAEQQATIQRFRGGECNVLLCTSVGEEGLDIGEVDLIVFYDVPESATRTVQRMGRTGRKRAGRVVVLEAEGEDGGRFERARAAAAATARFLRSGAPGLIFHKSTAPVIPEGVEPAPFFRTGGPANDPAPDPEAAPAPASAAPMAWRPMSAGAGKENVPPSLGEEKRGFRAPWAGGPAAPPFRTQSAPSPAVREAAAGVPQQQASGPSPAPWKKKSGFLSGPSSRPTLCSPAAPLPHDPPSQSLPAPAPAPVPASSGPAPGPSAPLRSFSAPAVPPAPLGSSTSSAYPSKIHPWPLPRSAPSQSTSQSQASPSSAPPSPPRFSHYFPAPAPRTAAAGPPLPQCFSAPTTASAPAYAARPGSAAASRPWGAAAAPSACSAVSASSSAPLPCPGSSPGACISAPNPWLSAAAPAAAPRPASAAAPCFWGAASASGRWGGGVAPRTPAGAAPRPPPSEPIDLVSPSPRPARPLGARPAAPAPPRPPLPLPFPLPAPRLAPLPRDRVPPPPPPPVDLVSPEGPRTPACPRSRPAQGPASASAGGRVGRPTAAPPARRARTGPTGMRRQGAGPRPPPARPGRDGERRSRRLQKAAERKAARAPRLPPRPGAPRPAGPGPTGAFFDWEAEVEEGEEGSGDEGGSGSEESGGSLGGFLVDDDVVEAEWPGAEAGAEEEEAQGSQEAGAGAHDEEAMYLESLMSQPGFGEEAPPGRSRAPRFASPPRVRAVMGRHAFHIRAPLDDDEDDVVRPPEPLCPLRRALLTTHYSSPAPPAPAPAPAAVAPQAASSSNPPPLTVSPYWGAPAPVAPPPVAAPWAAPTFHGSAATAASAAAEPSAAADEDEEAFWLEVAARADELCARRGAGAG
eukprot:tig00021350_g20640.t1